jgi:hypothetical protein
MVKKASATKTKKTVKSQKRKSSFRLGFIPESQRARARFFSESANGKTFALFLCLFGDFPTRGPDDFKGGEALIPLSL